MEKYYKGSQQAILLNRRFNIFTVLWELPQNIIGLIVFFINRKRIRQKEMLNGRLFVNVPGLSVSLGHFIFWAEDYYAAGETKTSNKAHEYGHAIQSLMFGPLYLILIGIPSVIRIFYDFLYFAQKKKRWQGYFDGYPEKWANQLGQKFF